MIQSFFQEKMEATRSLTDLWAEAGVVHNHLDSVERDDCG